MTDSDVKKFLIEMAEHAVNIGPKYGHGFTLQEAFRLVNNMTDALQHRDENIAMILDCRPIQPGTPPENILTTQGYAGD